MGIFTEDENSIGEKENNEWWLDFVSLLEFQGCDAVNKTYVCERLVKFRRQKCLAMICERLKMFLIVMYCESVVQQLVALFYLSFV